MYLGTPPYGFQNTNTALRLAETALARGHRVRLFASADGVHVAEVGQRPAGIPDALAGLTALIDHGAQVELCGSCLNVRGLGRDRLASGAMPSSLKGLFTAVSEADVFVSFGG